MMLMDEALYVERRCVRYSVQGIRKRRKTSSFILVDRSVNPKPSEGVVMVNNAKRLSNALMLE